jgi:O-acetyl-ADP-ribose deacetylase (regulator of RNase III)
MLKKGDYVEGYEYYGEKIQRMRGWVEKVYGDGSVSIKCDDWYNGARENNLHSELGEIKVVEEVPGWYLDKNRYTIETIDGDVTEVDCDVILHQVNCKGVMGSGVALTIKQKYPEVYNEYVNFVKKNIGASSKLLGSVQLCKTTEGKYVANLFSQDGYGYKGKYTDYDALRKGLGKLNELCKGKTIALPYKMGSDRGGGDWNKVLGIIIECLTDCNILIVRYNK